VKLASIVLARIIALVELDELNLKGKVRLADAVPLLVQQFDFATYPKGAEDLDLEKGVTFRSGKAGDIVVDVLTLYTQAIVVESLSSTDDSQKALKAILGWAKSELGLTYEEKMIRRTAFVSQVVFYSDVPLLNAISPSLNSLAKKTSEFLGGIFDDGLTFEVAKIAIGHDPSARKTSIASFTLEHRVNTKFSDGKFFSEAPLPTKLHIKLLEELEADLSEAQHESGKEAIRRSSKASHANRPRQAAGHKD
jgi:hypothetical protein